MQSHTEPQTDKQKIMANQLVKEQFNRQAEKFAKWSVGKNIEYLNGYFDFCGIKSADRLLDVACGPGEFTIYIAQHTVVI